jgi:hypothetical protein
MAAVLKADLQARAKALGLFVEGTKADLEARIAEAEAAATDHRGRVRTAFDLSVAAATHLMDVDAGAVEAARALADKIDAWDVIVEWALDDANQDGTGRPRVPQNDNVSLASFLKYCDALGLTPAQRKDRAPTTATPGVGSRKKSEVASDDNGAGGTVSSLSKLRSRRPA